MLVSKSLSPPWRLPVRASAYLKLCKLRVVALMMMTAWVGMVLAPWANLNISVFMLSSLGIGLTASAAAAINHVVDRHIDRAMLRTAHRPLVQGELTPQAALKFATLLGSLGVAVLYFFVNPLTAYLSFATFLGYAVFYTMYLKRATPQNIVIGGLAGATPPLLGWVSVANHIDPYPWLLVLIIFTWTPPHFWALAIARREDYAKAGVPMLPITHGVPFTKLCILLYTLLLAAISSLPFAFGHTSQFYLYVSGLLNAKFIYHSSKLYRSTNNQQASPIFNYSIWYLLILFSALMIDRIFIPY